jgi:hypothetical protein
LISLLLSETSKTQLGVRTSRCIFPNNWGEKIKKKVKRPTYPNFLGYVTLITHIFFIWPMLLVKYAWINYIIIIYFIIIIYDVQVLIQMLCKLM